MVQGRQGARTRSGARPRRTTPRGLFVALVAVAGLGLGIAFPEGLMVVLLPAGTTARAASAPDLISSWGSGGFGMSSPADPQSVRDLAELRELGLLEVWPSSGSPGDQEPPSRYEVAVSLASLLSRLDGARRSPPQETGGDGDGDGSGSQLARPSSQGVALPPLVVVDAAALERLISPTLAPAVRIRARQVLERLVVEFAPELGLLGYRVTLARAQPGASSVTGWSEPGLPGSTGAGVDPATITSPKNARQPGEIEPAPVVPLGAGVSRFEWSYRLGSHPAPPAGYSLDGSDPVRRVTTGSDGKDDATPEAVSGEVLLVMPPVLGDQNAALIQVDAAYRAGDRGEARWKWYSPLLVLPGSQVVLQPGSISSLGGEMEVLPGLTLRGELAQALGGKEQAVKNASMLGTKVVLGEVQVGATARWFDPGFGQLAEGAAGTEMRRLYDLEVKGRDLTLSAQFGKLWEAGTEKTPWNDLPAGQEERTIRAVGLSYDVSNLAVIRAGYEWIDPAGNGSAGATGTILRQEAMQFGIGLATSAQGKGTIRADVTWKGTTPGAGGEMEVSTTASLEYRLLPWSARFLAGTHQGGRSTAATISLGYTPSADTSFWIGYRLAEYRADQDSWNWAGFPDNSAQAGLTIRF